jgi:hypothetical protein
VGSAGCDIDDGGADWGPSRGGKDDDDDDDDCVLNEDVVCIRYSSVAAFQYCFMIIFYC